MPATIWSHQLSADGMSFAPLSIASALISADRGWEGGTVEAPDLVAVNGELVLFYSGNNWSSASYALGAAICSAPSGPCNKTGGPVYTSHALIVGPGSAGFFTTSGGGLAMVYDAYHAPNVGYPASRYLYVASVHVSGSSISFG
jgi:hypothetical protein